MAASLLTKVPSVVLTTNRPFVAEEKPIFLPSRSHYNSPTCHFRLHVAGQLRHETLRAAGRGVDRLQLDIPPVPIPTFRPEEPKICRSVVVSAVTAAEGPQTSTSNANSTSAGNDEYVYDAVVVGAGMGGIVAACQLAERGVKVLLLEKYLIPGGSAGRFQRDGYTFDVGASVMFGLGTEGNVNLVHRALASAGRSIPLLPDPVTVHYHLPAGCDFRVHHSYEEFLSELVARFPHEEKGIRGFYGECWTVYNALNALELRSLEEPLYLFQQFLKNPLACLTLAYYLPQNTGDIARKHISDSDLLQFIDAECFIVSTVRADNTPILNAAMVMCDRHFGGINYPVGGVGRIPEELVEGLKEFGGEVWYGANVKRVLLDSDTGRAAGVVLADGRVIKSKAVISNATRWDTFGKLVPKPDIPAEESAFQQRYVQAPSFLSMHVGVRADVLPSGTECHHLILEDDWARMEDELGTIFLSIPTVLDSSLAPPNRHILHVFLTSSMDNWQGLSSSEYEVRKASVAAGVIKRLEKTLFPGLSDAIEIMEVGTPRTHRRFLGRPDGTYGPLPAGRPLGLLGMPFNTTSIPGLYCVGDSSFPGQGVIAVAFSGIMCAHRVAADFGIEPSNPTLDKLLSNLLSSFRGLVKP